MDAEERIARLEQKLRRDVSDDYRKQVRQMIRDQKQVLDQIPVRMIETIMRDRSAVSPAENVINLNLKEQTDALRHPSRSPKLKAFLEGRRI